MVLLGASCGVVRGALRHVDVAFHLHTARCIPVLGDFQDDMRIHTERYPSGAFVTDLSNPRSTDTFTAWVKGHAGVPALQGDRLRSYLIYTNLERGTSALVGEPVFDLTSRSA
jgi:hypothetical protein